MGDQSKPQPAVPSTPGSVSERGQHLQRIIRRGKGRDKFFAILGASLIALSLGTLGVLIVKLLIDGGPFLFHSQEVRTDGNAPRYNTDRLGAVRKLAAAEAGKPPTWEFTGDPSPVDVSSLAGNMKDEVAAAGGIDPFLAGLDGKRVVMTGAVPVPQEAPIAAEAIKPLMADTPEAKPGAKLARYDTVGTLRRKSVGKGELPWEFAPEPVALDFEAAKASPPPDEFDGQRVAVSLPTRLPLSSKRFVGKFVVTDISKLKKQSFLFSFPGSSSYRAGIYSAWVGSLLVMVATMLTTLPLGVAAGMYLEEYAPKNRLTALIEINIANLAGVPSIVWGLLGLGIFVQGLSVGSVHLTPSLGKTILVAGLTLGLLVLPIVIISTREAIRAIPGTIRDASFALGATKWQTVSHHVLPYSMGGILTGSIVALSRAIGETAPLIVIGAVTYLSFLPPPPIEYRVADAQPAAVAVAEAAGTGGGEGAAKVAAPAAAEAAEEAPAGEKEWHFQPFAWLKAAFTVLPIQMFDWTGRPQHDFHRNAAAAGLLLIGMTLLLNSVAIWLRARLRKKIKW